MVLDGLKNLYKSMKRQDLERARFQYSYRNLTFDVFFFIDENPYCLLFGAVQFNFAFEFAVRAGFVIEPRLSADDYKTLCAALELKFDPNNPFRVKAFLEKFNEHIPNEILPGSIRPEQVAKYRRDVEEADKIYFFQWRDNNAWGKNVTSDNLSKTKRILGNRAYEVCLKRNISSCWTDDPLKRRDPPNINNVDVTSTA